MTVEVLESTFRSIFRSKYLGRQLSIVWHAGEPLTLPPSWYDAAISMAEKLKPSKLVLDFHFQSNGMLLCRDWLPLLRQPNVHIGLSIDGPQWLHDSRRKTRGGRGTYGRAMQGLSLLREAQVPFHVISVLSDKSLNNADELFDFYVENEISDVAFNIEEIDGACAASTLNHSCVEEKFRRFMVRFFKRILDQPQKLRLRELQDMLSVIHSNGLNGRRSQDADPLRIVSVEVAGNVSSFSPEFLGTKDVTYGDYCFGNILTDEFDLIARRIWDSTLHAHIDAGIRACERSCAWFPWCGGGSPCNKLAETGSLLSTETMHCRLMRQILLDVTLSSIEERVQA